MATKGVKLTEEHKRKIKEALNSPEIIKKFKSKRPYRKGVALLKNRGEGNGRWKGNDVSYYGLHMWVIKKFGNPPKCEDCGTIGKKEGRHWNIQWSNKDHKYRRVKKDYSGRCMKCHGAYDAINNLRKPGNNYYKRHSADRTAEWKKILWGQYYFIFILIRLSNKKKSH